MPWKTGYRLYNDAASNFNKHLEGEVIESMLKDVTILYDNKIVDKNVNSWNESCIWHTSEKGIENTMKYENLVPYIFKFPITGYYSFFRPSLNEICLNILFYNLADISVIKLNSNGMNDANIVCSSAFHWDEVIIGFNGKSNLPVFPVANMTNMPKIAERS